MEFLDHYLEIQRASFWGSTGMQCVGRGGYTLQALIPSMTIQPLVENAIRHGISKRTSGGGTVTVAAERRNGAVSLCVKDDGEGLSPGWDRTPFNRLGLSIVRQRLAGLYASNDSSMEVKARPEGGVEVRIQVPLRYMACATEKQR